MSATLIPLPEPHPPRPPMLTIDAMSLSVPDLSAARPVRVAVVDPNGGDDITGTVDRELSGTHVRLRADDGLVFAVEKAALRILPRDEVL